MRGLSGLNKLVGFGLSMAMLAAASLVAIPAMVHSSGIDGWGAAAYGQNLGGIGAMVVAYGWGIAGPAEVAQGDRASRTLEFIGSVKVRLFLLLPVTAAVVIPLFFLVTYRLDLAVVGAIVAILPGLTSNWFLIGLARPYVLMLVETVPRVLCTIVGIIAMTTGSDAIVGLTWQGIGLLAAFVGSGVWILWFLKYDRAHAPAGPGLLALLKQYRHGVASSIGGSLFASLPLVIVYWASPVAYPMFALVDKLTRQVTTALVPIISVLQGWVPRIADPAPRAKKVIFIGAGAGALITLGTLLCGQWALHLLGRGQATPPIDVMVMMSITLGLGFWVFTLGHAVLATYHKMRELAFSTAAGIVVGMPLVALGAWQWGVVGALGGITVGLLVRLTIKLVISVQCIRSHAPVGSGAQESLLAEEIG